MADVLIVDDDKDLREALRELLESEGYSVAEAQNGAEALEHLRAMPSPCLVLLDLRMPHMDGIAFREAQREDPELASIPVVVMTASSFPNQLDVDGFVPKPMELDHLLDQIGRRCRHSRTRAACPART